MSDASDFVAESMGLPKVLGKDDGSSLNLSWAQIKDVFSFLYGTNKGVETERYPLVDKCLEGIEL
jgi:hypothetical protein